MILNMVLRNCLTLFMNFSVKMVLCCERDGVMLLIPVFFLTFFSLVLTVFVGKELFGNNILTGKKKKEMQILTD